MNILIPLIAIGTVLFMGYEGFGWKGYIDDFVNKGGFAINPLPTNTASRDPVAEEAWQTLEEYMGYAKAHDFEGVKKLTYRLSETCANESTREECFALMDSVYSFFSFFRQDDFKNVLTGGNKVILFTDSIDKTRVAYLFIRDEDGILKVAGMKFCQVIGTTPDECSTLQ